MREFTCGTCEKKFTRKGNLLRHQREKHPDDVPDESPTQYSCDVCGKTFRYEANLKKHQKLHTPTWTCGICGRSGFKTSAELFHHENQFHGGNRPQCSRGQQWEDPLECPPDVETLYDCEDEEIVNCIRQHWNEIRSRIVGSKLSANRELFLLKMASIQDGVESKIARGAWGLRTGSDVINNRK